MDDRNSEVVNVTFPEERGSQSFWLDLSGFGLICHYCGLTYKVSSRFSIILYGDIVPFCIYIYITNYKKVDTLV